MTITLTYDTTLGRIQVTADGLAAADTATVERSTDMVRWTTVRGGAAVSVTAGALDLPVDDYEWTTDQVNYYRVRGIETAPISFRGHATTAASANAAGTATISPTLPAGLVEGDLMLLAATIRNKGVGSPGPQPAGWKEIRRNNNVVVYQRRYVPGDSPPTVTFVAGVANATITAKIMAWQAVAEDPVTTAADTGVIASEQDIPHLGIAVDGDGRLVVATAWKPNAWTSVAPLDTMTEIHDTPSTLGDDASVTTDYVIQTTAADIPAGSWVVTGGSSSTSTAVLLVFEHAAYLNEQYGSITPSLGGQIWLKSLARPFLNQPVSVRYPPSVTTTRPARVGLFPVIGRSAPVAVSTVRGAQQWSMYVRTETLDASRNLEYLLASGDVLFVHAPAGSITPTAYVSVGDVSRDLHPLRPLRRRYTLPMSEVAAPGPEVVGATVTWQTVLNTYATWADLMAAHATWADLLTLVGDPSEVIVP